jgi:acylphosphatase
MNRCVHLLIKGKVQGVFYRASAKKMAESLSVAGWIKNQSSGAVEAIITGEDKALEEFIDWCKKGPGSAVVREVIVAEGAVLKSREEGFQIIR